MEDAVKASYQSLPPLERARLFQTLIKNGSYASQVARDLGKSLSYVSNTLRLLKLPAMVQEGLMSNTLSEGHARALLALKDDKQMLSVYREILINSANVRQTEEMVRKIFRGTRQEHSS